MGEDKIAAWRGQQVGVIFQFFQLLPMLTCAQNVMLPMDFANLYGSPKERRERAYHLLDQVGIADQAAQAALGGFGRPAPAGGHCPRPGQRSGLSGRRRADGQPGLQDGRGRVSIFSSGWWTRGGPF